MDNLINIGIIITYIMIGFAALSAILFGVKKILSNTKNAKKTLYTILGLVIVSFFRLFWESFNLFINNIL